MSEVALLRNLIGMEAGGTVEVQGPEQRGDGLIARGIAASAAALLHLVLRITARTVRPFQQHPLRPLGKTVAGNAALRARGGLQGGGRRPGRDLSSCGKTQPDQ